MTIVTAVIRDPSGNTYVNALVEASYLSNIPAGTGTGPPLVSGSVFQTFSTSETDSFGNLSMSLTDLALITPTGGSWFFNVLNNARTIGFSLNSFAVTGATVDLTAAFAAVSAPLIPASGFNNVTISGFESFAEIAAPAGAAGFDRVYGDSTAHRLTVKNNNGAAASLATLLDTLGAFASTTSAQLGGVISDKTGTGSAVFGTGPTVLPKNLDGIRFSDQFASLQAAHDDLPAGGGTIFIAAGSLPFGAAGTTACTVTKPCHLWFDAGTFTYSGSATAITVNALVRGVQITGVGQRADQSQPPVGTVISVTNTAANGIVITNGPGIVMKEFVLDGPASGTGVGIRIAGNGFILENVQVDQMGSDGVVIDGTSNNANAGKIIGGNSTVNGGAGYKTVTTNASAIVFVGTVSIGNAINYDIASLANIFLGAQSQGATGGIGYVFRNGAIQNWGSIYSEPVAPETTAASFAAGANFNRLVLMNNNVISDSGTKNVLEFMLNQTQTRIALGAGTNGLLALSFGGAVAGEGFYEPGSGNLVYTTGGLDCILFGSSLTRQRLDSILGWSSNTVTGNPSDINLNRKPLPPGGSALQVSTGETGTTPGQILFAGKVGETSIVAASAAINTTETIIVKCAALPANRLVAGTVIRCILQGTCTATVANTSTFAIRIGTNGTTADGLVFSAVTAASAAAGTTIPFRAILEMTVRTSGAAATSFGTLTLENQGTTGIATVAIQVISASMSAFNTTTGSLIVSATYVSAAATTTSTFQQGFIELVYQ